MFMDYFVHREEKTIAPSLEKKKLSVYQGILFTKIPPEHML